MNSWRKNTLQSSTDTQSIEIPASLNFLIPKKLDRDSLIRIGDKRDGGYVLPSQIATAAESLISFGLGANFSFEKTISKFNPTIPIAVYDHSVSLLISSKSLVRGIYRAHKMRSWADVRSNLSAIYHPTIFILKYILFFKIKPHTKHIQEKVVSIAKKGREASISDIMADSKPNALVKIDIEGGEYDILSTVLDNASNIICLVVEFHDIYARQSEFVRLLDQASQHFALAHIHVNNAGKVIDDIPDILELTFVEKRRVLNQPIKHDLPIIGLDFRNLIYERDYELTFSGNK